MSEGLQHDLPVPSRVGILPVAAQMLVKSPLLDLLCHPPSKDRHMLPGILLELTQHHPRSDSASVSVPAHYPG